MSDARESGVDPWAEAEAAVRREQGKDDEAVNRIAPATPKPAAAGGAHEDEGDVPTPLAEAPEVQGVLADAEEIDADASDDATDDGGSAADVAGAIGTDADDAPAADGATSESDGLDDASLLRAVSALVLAAPEPLSTGRLAALVGEPDTARVRTALEAFGERLGDAGLGIELREIAGGWRLTTSPDLGELVGQMFASRKTDRISQAGLETLSIVAYRQPVTKAEIEAIRGVQAGPILRTLVDRGLIRVTGRADQPGAPLLYGTTRLFLDRFGLARIEDLPRDGELARD